ncbi:DUF1622 domain-containing protein [Microvirga sp. 2YAF29]|uniref:DUF1622 domain-containing protein n=1 Tax=Microvirga sp. 2YAF29 TaxID=3233031 RepID=UPI003F962D59
MDEWFPQALRLITRMIEVGGIAVIVLGILGASVVIVRQLLQGGPPAGAFNLYRSNIGRAILLGLEFLVAADIINTVAIEPTLESLMILGGIVIIRTFLSFSLEVEIEGRWPWKRYKAQETGSPSFPTRAD